MFIVSDTPRKHPRISEEEKNYITTSIGDSGDRQQKVKVTREISIQLLLIKFTMRDNVA